MKDVSTAAPRDTQARVVVIVRRVRLIFDGRLVEVVAADGAPTKRSDFTQKNKCEVSTREPTNKGSFSTSTKNKAEEPKTQKTKNTKTNLRVCADCPRPYCDGVPLLDFKAWLRVLRGTS